jgi:hypothetical protein
MRELGRLCRTYCYQSHTEWPKYLSYIEWVLKNTVHESTGLTPHELFCKEPNTPLVNDLISFPPSCDFTQERTFVMAREIQLSKAALRKRRHDLKGPPLIFNVGD